MRGSQTGGGAVALLLKPGPFLQITGTVDYLYVWEKAKISKFHGCLLGFGLCITALQGGKDADRAFNGHIRCTTS